MLACGPFGVCEKRSQFCTFLGKKAKIFHSDPVFVHIFCPKIEMCILRTCGQKIHRNSQFAAIFNSCFSLFRSEHSCQVTVFGDGRLESSDCTETHVFQPFSSASSGAIANVRRQVKLVGKPTPSATSQRLTETRASSLIFSHPDQKDQASNDQAKLVLALLNSFKSASETAKPEMFSQLVHSMRQLSHSQLLNIFYNGITDPELRILALDAIPLLKTDAGIALMKDIIETGELPSETLNMWFSTLPYYKNPTRAMPGVVSVSVASLFRE